MVIESDQRSNAPGAGVRRIRTIAYWIFTLIVAYEMIAGSMWDLLQIEYVQDVLRHLGYPAYLLLILGVWKLPCGVVWLVPRFPRLKEWAYAGAIFNYTGAAASHILAGDGPKVWVAPAVFALLTLASWALRPPERRLQPGKSRPHHHPPRRLDRPACYRRRDAGVRASHSAERAGPNLTAAGRTQESYTVYVFVRFVRSWPFCPGIFGHFGPRDRPGWSR